jgi:hypothetical protein
MDEHQHIGRPGPSERKHGLREEVAGNHGFHVRTYERGPRQGRLLLASFGAGVNASFVQDALDGISRGRPTMPMGVSIAIGAVLFLII